MDNCYCQVAYFSGSERSKCVFAGHISEIAWLIVPIQWRNAYKIFQFV